MRTLHMTVGLPRSGKSTWAQDTGWPVVNPDSIRIAMHGQDFVPEAEDMVWAIAKYMVKALFVAGHSDVVLDATNVSKHRRNEWRVISAWSAAKIEMHVIDTDPKTCKERARADGRDYLVPVIDRMAKDWDLPKPKSWSEEEVA